MREAAVRVPGRNAVGVVCLIFASVLMLWSVPARGNVRSQALYARGLIAFNDAQWAQATRLFGEAVQADPSDALALYYRGLAQGHEGHFAAAIQDIEQALKLSPALPHAALDLGIACFNSGQYAPARTWLERAYEQGTERFTAAYFLGLTLYRSGEDAAAGAYLKEAEADPELRPSAHYYAGLALLRQGKPAAARGELVETAREQPQSEIGKAAQAYAGGAGVRQPPARLAQEHKKPWSLYAALDFQYDSNVVIAPSDSEVKAAEGISRQADGRSVIAAGGSYFLLDGDAGSVRAQYDLYQSVHFRLTKFDLQGHRVRLDVASKPAALRYGLACTYDFYALDYQSFFQEGLATPWVALAESPAAVTQAYYTLRGRDFFRKPFSPARDGIDNAAGLRQYIDLGSAERVLSFGYQFDSDDTTGHDFKYDAHQVDVGVTLPLLDLANARLGYLFRLEDYQSPNSRAGFRFRRHDSEHQFAVALSHDLTPTVALTLAYVGVLNNSNLTAFEYDRDIVSGGVQVTF
ncbi:MAG: tetratricopeptide repeat protein [Candidatus Binatia bacterium]